MAVEELTKETFDDAVAEGIVVLDFWAEWCGPCKAMGPQFAKASEERPQYRFGKINTDEQPELAAKFGVQSIPTIAVLHNGELVGQGAGLVPADALVKELDRVAAEFSGEAKP